VAAVDFYWHGPDAYSGWVKLGTDTNASDGWGFNVDPAAYGGVRSSSVYVQAISRTGGVRGTALWNLEPDLSIPTSQMNGLPAQVNSTAVQLTWSASDAQGDIDRFEVQYQVNNGSGFSAWQSWTAQSLPGSLRSAWFVGNPGSSYRFRMRAIDQAGNAEAFPDAVEATTSLAASCVPDPNENGQTADNALNLPLGEPGPLLNLCKSAQSGSDDVDWFTFDAQADQELLLMIIPRMGGAKLTISLYSDTSELLGTWQSPYGMSTSTRFIVPRTGSYYVEIKPAHTGLYGTDMTYQTYFGEGTWLYLPIIGR
jgi:hypothetical protein